MNIAIRKFEEKDIPNKIKWINDSNNNKYLHYNLPLKYDKTLNWFLNNKERTDRYDAVIEAEGVPVGLIGLLSIDKKNSKAEYYITIGEDKYKGKGIAKLASEILLEYAFEKLQINKVYLFTETENIKAQKLFKKIGFKKEGLLKEDVKNINGFVDRYVYEICKDDYYFEGQINAVHLNSTEIFKSNLDLNNNIYIKREDLIPVSFGGNKARKAKFFFKDIEKLNSDCVVTYGSSSSNHCRIVANIAASKGLKCVIISPIESSKITFNSQMMKLFGAEILRCKVSEVKEMIDNTLENLKDSGYNPYFIQGGGHGNLGTKAYVEAYEEIREFESKNNIYFDYIFHTSGTGTTQAGLICGKLIHKDNRKIIGISNARKNPYGGQVVLDSVNDYLKSIGKENVGIEEIDFIDKYVIDGYGSFNNEIIKLINEILIKEGIPLDTTYTGKGFWGMEQYIKENQIKGKNILFIHTGGTPLFFDDLEEIKND